MLLAKKASRRIPIGILRNAGSTLSVPKRHISSGDQLTPEERHTFFSAACLRVFLRSLEPYLCAPVYEPIATLDSVHGFLKSPEGKESFERLVSGLRWSDDMRKRAESVIVNEVLDYNSLIGGESNPVLFDVPVLESVDVVEMNTQRVQASVVESLSLLSSSLADTNAQAEKEKNKKKNKKKNEKKNEKKKTKSKDSN
jgi:hypothetical protein